MRQAIWLVPTERFKRLSMKRRKKPSFQSETSDPEAATRNLFMRDILLAERVKARVESFGLSLREVDGSSSADEMADLIEMHIKPLPLFSQET